MALIWKKKVIFDLLFTFLVTRERTQKFFLHTSHLHTYTYFAHPNDYFTLTTLVRVVYIVHTAVQNNESQTLNVNYSYL